MRAKAAKHGHKKAPHIAPSADTVQFWNCLKKGDVEGLEEILLTRIEDKETGAVTLAVNSNVASLLVNRPNAKNMLPLSYAVRQRMDEAGLHLLLRAGANVDAAEDSAERSTALHTACWGEDDAAVALFLRCGANPLVTNAEGSTPLHVLTSLNAAELFSYFLETATAQNTDCQGGLLCLDGRSRVVVSAFELLGKKDVSGFTVLHIALSEIESVSGGVLVDLLDFLTHMANIDPAAVETLVNMGAEAGCTPLHLLLSSSSLNEDVLLRITERLLKLGANPAAMDECGHTPLSVLLLTHSGVTAMRVLSVLLHALQKKGNRKELEEVFLRHSAVNGFALIHHAIVTQNVDAVKLMVTFLKSVDGADELQYVRRWLGEVLTRDGVHVVFMLAERACDDIAHVLLNASAIDERAYNCCKENCKKQREEMESEERERRAKAEEEEEEEGRNGNGTPSAEKNTGDYSGFGGTASVGSRVQQARKARAHAATQRKKQTLHCADCGSTEGLALSWHSKSFWFCVAVAFLIVWLVMRSCTFFRDALNKI
ncbi:hypothetical protein TraAM80_03649 [Trypanosoma rangeli]|uniref:Uncharacterized protein n=1 Tax=Trypanosoma rangeli TaxID=5698 RepID=A0A3R7NHZ1_TRYRA|nr:uncharacterized protein TraAM80_03649 [Trypanosoma rangeli]RNF06816.1 hypothetical protein TraAM80_03649 [Trypanosoma rangeli]|eukprot:RNF06816.1 hypothetical protein TraAM80_03649 [Trypanosoma rangeli]